MKIAIVNYEYDWTISPTIKAIISYLSKQDHEVCFIENQNRNYSHEGLTNYSFCGEFPLFYWRTPCIWAKGWNFLFRKIFKIEYWRLLKFRKGIQQLPLNEYDLFVACEAGALYSIYCAHIPLSKVFYLSLELESMMNNMSKGFFSSLLCSCRKRLIQSIERANDLNLFLGTKLDFDLLPVSVYPPPVIDNPHKVTSEHVDLVFSGVFAEWSGVYELITAFHGMNMPNVSLLLQGHLVGNDVFWKKIEPAITKIANVQVDMTEYSDDELFSLLSAQTIGIAWYVNITDSPNWKNLIKSSGKISTYLWCGIPVITNCVSEDIGPFLAVTDLTPESLACCVKKVKNNRTYFSRIARETAEIEYNIEPYLQQIFRLQE